MSTDDDYILGTSDEELARLGLQHMVWRPRALDAWRRAGFRTGQTLLDVGCGPGFASFDLADIVGPEGRVVSFDRSHRYLDALEAERDRRGIGHITAVEVDLDSAPLPVEGADGAWGRWVFAFMQRPRDLLGRVRDALRPGGTLVVHEYLDYSTWQHAPPVAEVDDFVALVIEQWRATGGNPDIGLFIPAWLGELGFEIREMRTIVDVVSPSEFAWQWTKQFLSVGLERFVELGHLTAQRAREIAEAFAAAEASPGARVVTPLVGEIIADKRRK
jgi:SAM-dependent methyltransferase